MNDYNLLNGAYTPPAQVWPPEAVDLRRLLDTEHGLESCLSTFLTIDGWSKAESINGSADARPENVKVTYDVERRGLHVEFHVCPDCLDGHEDDWRFRWTAETAPPPCLVCSPVGDSSGPATTIAGSDEVRDAARALAKALIKHVPMPLVDNDGDIITFDVNGVED